MGTKLALMAAFNLAIALSYFGFGAILAQLLLGHRVRLAHDDRRVAPVLIGASLVFFVTCAMTHIELAYHFTTEKTEWGVTLHMLIGHGIQAFVGLLALFMFAQVLDAEIYVRRDE